MKIVVDVPDEEYECYTLAITFGMGSKAIRRILDGKPYEERKTGRWARQTDDYHDYYECEECGIAVGLDDIRNYCPNCGAKMEGAEE